MIGRCKNCKWRDDNGYCYNDEKIHEDDSRSKHYLNDHLVYDYLESGGFWVGPEFGCVHFEQKQNESGGKT